MHKKRQQEKQMEYKDECRSTLLKDELDPLDLLFIVPHQLTYHLWIQLYHVFQLWH